ncbi:MAG: diadenylate cyclase CdaA [Lachnospiraceae bacterium]|nr:diadenylate cyclase CdaA [Lachnospiraceae bacterium]
MFRLDFIENFTNSFNIFTVLQPVELILAIIEILIIAFVVNIVITWMKNTRAWLLFRGIVIIGLLLLLSVIFHFEVIKYIIQNLSYIAMIALIIIFQEDIRTGLEHLGRQSILTKLIPDIRLAKQTSKDNIQELVEASFSMGKVRTGALIVIEQNISLEEYERTGINIDGDISKQLLINIFEKNTPLHDGAVLIVGNVVKAATCYLPISRNQNISKALGTRHRAALGISEVSDSIVIVVSEETGNVSLCINGQLEVMKDEKQMTKNLMNFIYGSEEKKQVGNDIIGTVRGWLK